MTAAKPPDVSPAAKPPDVRQGSALPEAREKNAEGSALGSGFALAAAPPVNKVIVEKQWFILE
ncbi:MAG TPA: hypothetical protein VHS05_30495 [Pyrinomonadaceae bacterium]|nr:hypothetical protein [Pyrinomonadaceae bacterium]